MLVKIYNRKTMEYISPIGIDIHYLLNRRTNFDTVFYDDWIVLDNIHSLNALLIDIVTYKWYVFTLIFCTLTYGEENKYSVPSGSLSNNTKYLEFVRI